MNQSLTRFLFLNVGHSLTHIFMLIFPVVVLALEHEFDRPYSELLTLALPGFLAYGLGAFPAGWLADRWSRKGVLSIFFLGIGAAAVLTGFARSPLEIAGGLCLMGLFGSIYHPVGIAMVVETSGKMGKALGINGVWGNVGVALAALIAGGLTEVLGWSYAFIIPGALAFAVGVLFVIFVREPVREKAAKVAASTDSDGRRVPTSVYAVLIVGTLGASLIFNTTTVATPKLIEEGVSFLRGSVWGVGGVVSIIAGVAAFAQILTGHLIDRFPIRPIWLAIVLAEIPLLAIVGFSLDAGMLALAVPLTILIFGEIPIQDALLARYTSQAWRARLYGLKFALAIGTSAASVPLIAFLHDVAGNFTVVYPVLAGFALMVATAAFFLPASTRLRAAPIATNQPAE